MRRKVFRLAVLLPLALLLACGPRRTPQQEQESAVAVQLLQETADACDDLGFQVGAEWERLVDVRQMTIDAVDRIGDEVALRVTAPRGPEIALLQGEIATWVKGLEERRDPLAAPAQAAYKEARDHCAAVAYPGAYSPKTLDGDLKRLREQRNAAFRKLQGLAPKLGPEGQQKLQALHDQVAELQRKAAAVTPTRTVEVSGETGVAERAEAQGDSWDAASVDPSEAASRGLNLLSWSFREEGKNMRVEGEVFNIGTEPIEEGRVEIAFLDAGRVKKTVPAPLQSHRLASRESTRFSWVGPSDFRLRECRISFADRDHKTLEVTAKVPLTAYIERERH